MSAPAAALGVAARPARSGTAAAILGLVALAARPAGWWAVLVPLAVGIAALAWPVARSRVRPSAWLVATVIGGLAFAAVRFSTPGLAVRATAVGALVTVAVAIAEEAFFRRFLYDLLARRGAAVAVTVPALAFALIHVPLYGAWVVPLDLAAGLLLGWQRWTAGHWSSPAATHALANLLAYWR